MTSFGKSTISIFLYFSYVSYRILLLNCFGFAVLSRHRVFSSWKIARCQITRLKNKEYAILVSCIVFLRFSSFVTKLLSQPIEKTPCRNSYYHSKCSTIVGVKSTLTSTFQVFLARHQHAYFLEMRHQHQLFKNWASASFFVAVNIFYRSQHTSACVNICIFIHTNIRIIF